MSPGVTLENVTFPEQLGNGEKALETIRVTQVTTFKREKGEQRSESLWDGASWRAAAEAKRKSDSITQGNLQVLVF